MTLEIKTRLDLPNKKELRFITITDIDGLDAIQITNARSFFNTFEWCDVVVEKGKNGSNLHIHALVIWKKTTDALRREIKKNVYSVAKRSKIHPNALKVEIPRSVQGCLAYMHKEFGTDKYFVRKGIKKTWIDEQIKKKFENTKDFQKWKYCRIDQAPAMIVEYARLNHKLLRHKEDFKQIVIDLMTGDYNVRKWCKKADMEWIFAMVMLKKGIDDYANIMLDNILFGI